MNAASPRSMLSGARQPVSPRKSKFDASPSPVVQPGPDAGLKLGDVPDQKLQQDARRKGKKKNRKSLDQGKTKKAVENPSLKPLWAKVKHRKKTEVVCHSSVDSYQRYLEAEEKLVALQAQMKVTNAGTEVPEVAVGEPPCLAEQALQEAPHIPLEVWPMPVKFDVFLQGNVHPLDFYDEFKKCLDEFCDHKTPQNLNVGMTFAHLTGLANSIFGQVSAEDIGGRIDGISNYLLPSLSSLFARMERQLVADTTLNITYGFKSGLLDGLVMFDNAWQALNELAKSMDPAYQPRSLFGSGGPYGFLDEQWRQLDRQAEFVKARIQIVQ